MGNTNSENPSDNDWEDRGELVWNEFDWERYLRQQDEAVSKYLALYEELQTKPERLDEAAKQMGWGVEEWTSEAVLDGDDDDAGDTEASEMDLGDESDPYTLHKNPIYVATRALFLSLKRAWEQLADSAERVPQKLALSYYAALIRTEDQAMQAVSALDFGDYAMAISLFKRALRELNTTLAALLTEENEDNHSLAFYRALALPRLFDLREVWLRVMGECRDELARPSSEETDDESED
jgi:tetratricopeptide (TPR) repeat protein